MRKIYIKIFSLVILLLLASLFAFSKTTVAKEEAIVEVYPTRIFFFHSESCAHCRKEMKFLTQLKKDIPSVEIQSIEIDDGFRNESLFKNIVKKNDLGGGWPVTLIGDEIIEGYGEDDTTGELIVRQVAKCSQEICKNELDTMLALGTIGENSKIKVESSAFQKYGIEISVQEDGQVIESENGNEDDKKAVSVFGKRIDIGDSSSIVGLGIILGLADGINPCMFSVLLFLLTYLLAIGSRKKAFKAGMAFVITTFILYFLFMLGFSKVVNSLNIATPIRWIVSILAFGFGAIMIKDFFYYGKGISLEISERHKPTIEKLIKKGTIPSAIILAIFSGIVELPCTSAIPLAYVAIIAQQGISPIGPLILYNIFFILPILAIVLAVTFAWTKVDRLEEQRKSFRKWMRLIAGILLVLLALSLWFSWF